MTVVCIAAVSLKSAMSCSEEADGKNDCNLLRGAGSDLSVSVGN